MLDQNYMPLHEYDPAQGTPHVRRLYTVSSLSPFLPIMLCNLFTVCNDSFDNQINFKTIEPEKPHVSNEFNTNDDEQKNSMHLLYLVEKTFLYSQF